MSEQKKVKAGSSNQEEKTPNKRKEKKEFYIPAHEDEDDTLNQRLRLYRKTVSYTHLAHAVSSLEECSRAV